MPSISFRISIYAIGLMLLGVGMASGQPYPNKPIRVVTGNANDFVGRQIAQAISVPLGQPVIVDARPILLSIETVAKATPDGYTFLLAAGSFWIGPLLKKLSYDPVKDFSPITIVSKYPLVLLVNPSVPAKTVGELIALAKAKPGALNYGRGPTGASSHLGPELFKSLAGINVVSVPYKGSAEALNALMIGEVQMMVNNASTAEPFIRSGRLRALAVTSTEPSPLAPGLPTLAATLPGYVFEQLLGAFATAGTPAVIVRRLNQEIVRFLHDPKVAEQFLKGGAEVVGSSPAELSVYMKADIARMGKLIREEGIHDE